jgi:hypothetical protein
MLAEHYASSSSFNAMPSIGVGVGEEPIKHMIRQCFPFWCLMVNTSGGVHRFFLLMVMG